MWGVSELLRSLTLCDSGRADVRASSVLLGTRDATMIEFRGPGLRIEGGSVNLKSQIVATCAFSNNSHPLACDSGRDLLVLMACFWYGLSLFGDLAFILCFEKLTESPKRQSGASSASCSPCSSSHEAQEAPTPLPATPLTLLPALRSRTLLAMDSARAPLCKASQTHPNPKTQSARKRRVAVLWRLQPFELSLSLGKPTGRCAEQGPAFAAFSQLSEGLHLETGLTCRESGGSLVLSSQRGRLLDS